MGWQGVVRAEPVVFLYTLTYYMTRFTRQQLFETVVCEAEVAGGELSNTTDCTNLQTGQQGFTRVQDGTEDLLSGIQVLQPHFHILA